MPKTTANTGQRRFQFPLLLAVLLAATAGQSGSRALPVLSSDNRPAATVEGEQQQNPVIRVFRHPDFERLQFPLLKKLKKYWKRECK
jgi:hypothetical protein